MVTLDGNVNISLKNQFEKAVASEIVHLRKKNGFTGKELAEYVGVSQQQISRYESGISNINVGTLAIILNTFGCTSEEFFKKVSIRMRKNEERFLKSNR
ncbi:TPA: helix-turn-helix domain-containing protein [Providencia rettgeri]